MTDLEESDFWSDYRMNGDCTDPVLVNYLRNVQEFDTFAFSPTTILGS